MNFQLSDLATLTPHMVLVGTALLVLMVEAFGHGNRRPEATWISLLGIVIAAATTGMVCHENSVGFSGMLAADGYTAFFYVIIYVVGALTMLISADYLKSERREHGEYHALVLLAMVGMMLMAGATHLMLFFLALETMSIAIYALEGVESCFKYFLLGAFASGFMLYGIALVYASVGTTQIHAIMEQLATVKGIGESPLLLAGVALIAVGFLFKVAAFPFHSWTPDVYQGAPTSVTAFMATGVKAAVFAAFFRIFTIAFPATAPIMTSAFWVIAVATMTMGNFAAIAQTDLKRMLAYSSIAHAGYLMVGIITATPEAGVGMLFYLLTYAFMNIGAFACIIMVSKQGEGRTNLDDLSGLGFKYPLLGAALTIFMFSMAGLPPTAGFIGKFLLFKAAINEGYIWLAVLGVLNSAASVYFYLRVIVYLYFKPRPEDAPTGLRAGSAITIATAIAVGVILVLGVLPGAVVRLAEAAVTVF